MYRQAVLRELWDELDSVIYRLMTDGWEKGPMSAADMKAWGEQRGQAQGLVFAIAMVYNMSEPNTEWVRQEAMRRWEASLGEQTPISCREIRLVLRDRGWRHHDDRIRGDREVVGSRNRSRIRSARVRLGTVRRVAGGKGEQ